MVFPQWPFFGKMVTGRDSYPGFLFQRSRKDQCLDGEDPRAETWLFSDFLENLPPWEGLSLTEQISLDNASYMIMLFNVRCSCLQLPLCVWHFLLGYFCTICTSSSACCARFVRHVHIYQMFDYIFFLQNEPQK